MQVRFSLEIKFVLNSVAAFRPSVRPGHRKILYTETCNSSLVLRSASQRSPSRPGLAARHDMRRHKSRTIIVPRFNFPTHP